ncbi:hypothetical protein MMPV_003939 [Pyropia vietnamensis]
MTAAPARPTPPPGGDSPSSSSAAAASSSSSTTAATLVNLASSDLPTRRRALLALMAAPPPAAAILHSGVLDSSDEGVRLAAIAVLGRTVDDRDAVNAALLNTLASDGEVGVRAGAAGALGGVDPPGDGNEGGGVVDDGPGLTPEVRAGLRTAGAEDGHFMVRYSALVSLGAGRVAADVPYLLTVLGGCAKEDPNDQLIAQGAIMALAEMRLSSHADAAGAAASGEAGAGDTTAWVPDAVSALAGWASAPDGMTRIAVARALGVAATRWGAATVAAGVLTRMLDGEGGDVIRVVEGVRASVAAAERREQEEGA